jgi:hypothetical protein
LLCYHTPHGQACLEELLIWWDLKITGKKKIPMQCEHPCSPNHAKTSSLFFLPQHGQHILKHKIKGDRTVCSNDWVRYLAQALATGVVGDNTVTREYQWKDLGVKKMMVKSSARGKDNDIAIRIHREATTPVLNRRVGRFHSSLQQQIASPALQSHVGGGENQ